MVICILGDSITYGLRDSERGGWGNRLNNYFLGQKEKDVKVYNLSVCSETTKRLLGRVESECAPRDPEIVIFAVGVNDSRFLKSEDRREVIIEEFKKNLEGLLEKARKFTRDIVFIGLAKVNSKEIKKEPWGSEFIFDNENISAYSQEIENFCKGNDLKFISMSDVLDDGDLGDGLHPNSQGHEKMFEKIKVEVDDFLEERYFKE